jgi:hypothetical protein
MRAKFLVAITTGLGLLALTGLQTAAQAHEGYRYDRFEHRDHGRNWFWFHFRHHGRDHDRR